MFFKSLLNFYLAMSEPLMWSLIAVAVVVVIGTLGIVYNTHLNKKEKKKVNEEAPKEEKAKKEKKKASHQVNKAIEKKEKATVKEETVVQEPVDDSSEEEPVVVSRVESILQDLHVEDEQKEDNEPVEEVIEEKAEEVEEKVEEESLETPSEETVAQEPVEVEQNSNEAEEEEETATKIDASGRKVLVRYKKSFQAKLIQSPEGTKNYYNKVLEEVLAYKKVTSRISWNYNSINKGRSKFVKLNVRGKSLYVYLNLNADDYEGTKYKVEKVESKKYEDTPCLYKIKNDRRLNYVLELIAECANKLGLEKGEVKEFDTVNEFPYEDTPTLIEKGLIKEVMTDEEVPNEVPNKVPDVPEMALDEDEEIGVKYDEMGRKIFIRYKKSFLAKIIQSPDYTKDYYSLLLGKALSYKKVSSRISWNYHSINIGRTKLIKFNVRGKTLYVYLNLNADDYAGTKYKVEKVESKKYEDTPCLYKIKNDRRADYCLDLIEEVMKKYEVAEGPQTYVNAREAFPYEETEVLIEKELIKEVMQKQPETVEDSVVEETPVEETTEVVKEEPKKVEVVSAAEADKLIKDEVAEEKIEFTAKRVNKNKKTVKAVVNIDELASTFKANSIVNLEAMKKAKLVPSTTTYVKVLSRGTIDKPLTVEADDFSIQAVKMIVLTGGKVIEFK